MGVNFGDGVSTAIAFSYALGYQPFSRFSCAHEVPLEFSENVSIFQLPFSSSIFTSSCF